MSTQSIATSTTAASTIAPSTFASGFITGRDRKSPESTFIWSVKEVFDELRVSVNYGGGADTSNHIEVHIPFGDSNSHPIAGKNPDIKVEGEVRALWWGTDPKAGKYTSIVVLFSGYMRLMSSIGIFSDKQNEILVYAYLA